MSLIEKDKRFDELFNDWFDNDFRGYLICRMRNCFDKRVAEAYADVDRYIDDSIMKIREQVDQEFDELKEE